MLGPTMGREVEDGGAAEHTLVEIALGDDQFVVLGFGSGHDLTEDLGFGASRYLAQPYFFPLKMLRSLKPDPLAVVLSAMPSLTRNFRESEPK